MKTVYLLTVKTGFGDFATHKLLFALECQHCAEAQRLALNKQDDTKASVVSVQLGEHMRDGWLHNIGVVDLAARSKVPACGHAPVTIAG